MYFIKFVLCLVFKINTLLPAKGRLASRYLKRGDLNTEYSVREAQRIVSNIWYEVTQAHKTKVYLAPAHLLILPK
jgi:hypothetical protein